MRNGKIQSARIGVTGAGPRAVRLARVEQALAGQSLSKETLAAAVKGADAELQIVNADIHASEQYRRAMIPIFARRALEAVIARL